MITMCCECCADIMRAAALEPLVPYPGALKPWKCRHIPCGKVVEPSLHSIQRGQGGCGHCAGNARLDPGAAAEVMRAAGIEPLVPYRSVMTPWRCRCLRCGEIIKPTLNNIKRGQGGCGWCARNIVDPAKASEVMRKAGLSPMVSYPGRHAPWDCCCLRCGETVSPTYGAILAGGGCRFCNDTSIDPATAAKLMKSVGLEPLEPYPGALRPWPCQCSACNQVVYPCYSTVQRGMGGCRWCRDSGFKSAKRATVYLITNESFGAVKIGITDASASRLKKHHGWNVILTIHTPGRTALATEAAILRWWRNELKLPAYLGPSDMPQGGWTETVAASEINIPETIRRIRVLAHS
jgi:hypothetical protein